MDIIACMLMNQHITADPNRNQTRRVATNPKRRTRDSPRPAPSRLRSGQAWPNPERHSLHLEIPQQTQPHVLVISPNCAYTDNGRIKIALSFPLERTVQYGMPLRYELYYSAVRYVLPR